MNPVMACPFVCGVIATPDIFFLIAEHFDNKSWLNMRRVCRLWEYAFNKLCKYPPYALAMGRPLCNAKKYMTIMYNDRMRHKRIAKAAAALKPDVYLDTLCAYLADYESTAKLSIIMDFTRRDPKWKWHAKMLKPKLDLKALMELTDPELAEVVADEEVELLYDLLDPKDAVEFTMAHPQVAYLAMMHGVEAWDAYDGRRLQCPENHNHDKFMEGLIRVNTTGVNWSCICPDHISMLLESDLRFASDQDMVRTYHEAFFMRELGALINAFGRHNLSISISFLQTIDDVKFSDLESLYELAPELVDTEDNREYLQGLTNPDAAPLKKLMGLE